MGNHDQSLRLSKKKKIGRHISRVLMIVFAAVVVISVIFAMVQSRFNGVYFMPGYGMSLRARFGFITVYQTTDSYYCKDSDYSGIIIGNTLYSGMGRFGVEIEGDLLRLKDAGAQYTYDLQREKDSFLKNKSKVDASRPEEAFHMYYEMLRENYAFFDLYGVNPEARYDRIWSRLSNQETTLIEAMKDLVDEVYDGHIGITYRDQEYSPAGESPSGLRTRNNWVYYRISLRRSMSANIRSSKMYISDMDISRSIPAILRCTRWAWSPSINPKQRRKRWILLWRTMPKKELLPSSLIFDSMVAGMMKLHFASQDILRKNHI